MIKNKKPPRKVDEIMASLTHPATMGAAPKPYVFLEGSDDVVIYREIAERIGLSTSFPSFEGLGGRSVILILHDKIQEQKAHIKAQVLFFADRDTSVFAPYFAEFEDKAARYPQINFTKGYSIENDLFEDGQGRIRERLRSEKERLRLTLLLESVCEWFAAQMELYRNDDSATSVIDVSMSNPEVIKPGAQKLSPSFLQQYNYPTATEGMMSVVKENYLLVLRGKYLFLSVSRIVKDRQPGVLVGEIKEKHLWEDAIIQGLQTEGSNCRRIASIFQNAAL